MMTRILDWAEANAKPNLWALLLFTVLLRQGYAFHEIDRPSMLIGGWVSIAVLTVLTLPALRRAWAWLSRLRPSRAARGFTLIEIAILMSIIGFVAMGGLIAVKNMQDGNKTAITHDRIRGVEAALQAFVIVNQCLPCPALASATTGLQVPNTTACDAGGCTNATGSVPWVTLGLAEEDVADGWGRRFTYSIPNGLHVPNSMARGSGGAFPVAASGEGMVVDANEIVIEDLAGTTIAGGTTAPADPADIAYVIVSHGSDGAFGRQLYSAALGADQFNQGALDVGQNENADGDRVFARGNLNTSSSQAHFDDIIAYRSAQVVVLGCGSGACGNPE